MIKRFAMQVIAFSCFVGLAVWAGEATVDYLFLHNRLFAPFTRLDQVHTKGLGLGLSIVRRIVEKLSGQVGVQSRVGRGSVFTFTLPMWTSLAEVFAEKQLAHLA